MMNQSPIDPQIFEDIYGIEPIKWYQNPWVLGLFFLGVIGIIAFIAAIFYWYRRWQNQAWRVALQDVSRIEESLLQSTFDDCYQKISTVLRNYCYRGKVCSHDVTDSELFEAMLRAIPDQSAALVDTIDHIKKTKFAHYSPAQESVLTDLARLKVFIEQTKYI